MTPSTRKTILNAETLEAIQDRDDSLDMPFYSVFQKFYKNDLYSDLDKEVLALKPNDCAIVQKYAQMETFEIENHGGLKELTVNTIYSDHPLREFHRRSIKRLKDKNVTPEGLQKAEDQLQKIENLPLMVFIPGLGGQLSQFEPILQEFRNCSDIFGIDLPGFGNSKPNLDDPRFARLSEYTPEEIERLEDSLKHMSWNDYSSDSIADLLSQILLQKFPNRQYVFVAHSMGTHLTTKLVQLLPANKVEALVLLAPPQLSTKRGDPPRLPTGVRQFLGLCNYYPRMFDAVRLLDRKGGLFSKSVDMYVYGHEADLLKRVTQFRWNLDTDSQVFLRYVHGFTPVTAEELLSAASRLVGADQEPDNARILICCGDHDKVTKPEYSTAIHETLTKAGFGARLEFVKNANHSLFLDMPHTVSGTVYQFVSGMNLNIDQTWVLQVKAMISGDKWSMKNIQKWDKAVTLSSPLVNTTSPDKPKSPLLGMKTLRETDEKHNPRVFEKEHPEICAIIDIGSDTPSYEPKDFERIKYVKFKTESKVTPDDVTIAKFIAIVDELAADKDPGQYIVVHCHYGQNRTGFLISCYLVERLGWAVKEALDAFQSSKKPGVKHEHFKNALYLRYGE